MIEIIKNEIEFNEIYDRDYDFPIEIEFCRNGTYQYENWKPIPEWWGISLDYWKWSESLWYVILWKNKELDKLCEETYNETM